MPLNDLEVRVLELSGKGNVDVTASSSNQFDDFIAEDSDSEPLENIKMKASPAVKLRQSVSSAPRSPSGKFIIY